MASHEMGAQEIEDCARVGDFEGVRAVLSRVHALPGRQRSLRQVSIMQEAARTAAQYGQADCLLKLWELQASAGNGVSWSALGQAVDAQHVDCVRQILSTPQGQASAKGIGAQVGGAAASPLVAAVQKGNLECVKLLIPFSDVNDANNDQRHTPLMMALSKGLVDCAKALLAGGADVSRVDQRGRTALMLAASAPEDTHAVQLVQLLLPKSNPVRRSIGGVSAFEMALLAGNEHCAALLAPSEQSIGVEYHPSGSELMTTVQLHPNVNCAKIALRLFPEQVRSRINSQHCTPMAAVLSIVAWGKQNPKSGFHEVLFECADLLALQAGKEDVEAAIATIGIERLPRWRATQEHKQLGQALIKKESLEDSEQPPKKGIARPGRRL